jgi:hypothetical protein
MTLAVLVLLIACNPAPGADGSAAQKFMAKVEVCGIYKGDNRVCLDWTDRRWFASREACMQRALEIAGEVKRLTRFAGVKLERNPVQKCVEADR